MKLAIHQPQYLPWLGYFDKMDRADIFVLLDDVQYKKNEWQNRNKIRNAEGEQWLTVPVLHKFGQKINEICIDNKQSWREKHLKGIELNYSHSDYFQEHFSFFENALSIDWEFLSEVNMHFLKYLKDALEIETELIQSSSIDTNSSSTQRLVDICNNLKADTYVSGIGGKEYLDIDLFEKNGITLEFQEYKHPEYAQVFDGFHPYMSIVDLLFCHGEKSLDIIREGR